MRNSSNGYYSGQLEFQGIAKELPKKAKELK